MKKTSIIYLFFLFLIFLENNLFAEGKLPSVMYPASEKIDTNNCFPTSRSLNNSDYSHLKTTNKVLHLYGGENFDFYLGELNTNSFQANSIWNAYGTYGNKFSESSIWNKFCSYGGSLNTNSPFNSYCSNPPAIFDIDGNFYGYLTISQNRSYRSKLYIADIICKNWEKACDDLQKVYNLVSNYIYY